MRLFVVDTNVVVSGVLRYGSESAPARLLDAMIAGRLPFLLSADLLAEYRRVLLRPSIAERHGLEDDDVDVLLAALTMPAYLRYPDPDAGADSCDPPPETPVGDEHLVRLLAREPHSALISGDAALVGAVRGWRGALTPAEAVAEVG